ncbi:MAG: DUF58 domain-containing protein [Planctomycetota bacterium]
MNGSRRFLSPKVLAAISRLDLKARLIVEGFVSGLHQSPFHGFSVEFADHREYTPGDDIRHIDWKVYAKSDRFSIKEFEEETNLKCTMLLDVSESMRYRSGETSKLEYGSVLVATLSHLLLHQQDATGLVLFDSDIRRHVPESSRPSHILAILAELDRAVAEQKTDVSVLFHKIAEKIKRRGMVLLVSDLFCPVEPLMRGLKHFRHKRHEVVVFQIVDPFERDFPFEDNTLFKGLEGYPELLTEPRSLKAAYLKNFRDHAEAIRKACADQRIDFVQIGTDQPLETVLPRYLALRARR